MTFFAYQGMIRGPNSGTTGNISYTDAGFLPTSLIFWTDTGVVSAGDVAGVSFAFGAIGGVAASNMQSAHHYSNNNVATSAMGGGESSGMFCYSTLGTSRLGFSVAAYLSNGFTLNWSQAQNSQILVHYLAIGGTEALTSCASTTCRSGTGTQPVTGLGFRPSLVLFTYGVSSGVNVSSGRGAATSATSRWAQSESGANAATMTSTMLISRIQDTTKCISLLAAGGVTTLLAAADLVSMDADGFTLNWTTASTTVTFSYVAFGGTGSYATGTLTKAANTTDTSQTVNAGLLTAPKAYMLFGSAATNTTAQTTGWRNSVGATDGTRYDSVCYEAKSATTPSQCRTYHDDTGAQSVLRQRALPASVSAAGATELVVTHSAFTPTGFTVGYPTNNQATAFIMPYITFGGAPITEPVPVLGGTVDAFEA